MGWPLGAPREQQRFWPSFSAQSQRGTKNGSLYLAESSVPKSVPKYVRIYEMCVVFWVRFATRGTKGQKRGYLPAPIRGGIVPVWNRTDKTTHILRFVTFFQKVMAQFDYLYIITPNLGAKGIIATGMETSWASSCVLGSDGRVQTIISSRRQHRSCLILRTQPDWMRANCHLPARSSHWVSPAWVG